MSARKQEDRDTNWLFWAFALTSLVGYLQGCAQPTADPAPAFDLAMTRSPVGAYENDCTRVFSPTPEAEPYVRAAVERWSAATGCDIRIGAGGVPAAMVPEIITPDGGEAAGVTNIIAGCVAEYIHISEQAYHKYSVALHEVGHALAQPCDATKSHTDTGIMTYDSREDVIDEASLSLICEGFDCRAFNPEP